MTGCNGSDAQPATSSRQRGSIKGSSSPVPSSLFPLPCRFVPFAVFRRATLSSLVASAFAVLAACGDIVSPESTSGAAGPQPNGGPRGPSSPTPTPPPSSNPIAGVPLYVSPSSRAQQTADDWRTTRPADAQQMDKIAAQPQTKWFGSWNTDVRADVDRAVAAATSANALAVLVAYNIPLRDCGRGYSAGGASTAHASTAQEYRDWISAFADGIGARRAVVILEPDALAGMGCLSATDQQTRTELLSYAVETFKALGATSVYIDAGHSHWQSASAMAKRLTAASVAKSDGFSLNVSNFHDTSEQVSYGNSISALVGGKHYVIDTSRNGLGSAGDDQWCNPEGRALGERPTAATEYSLVDAYLWIKVPGESDGACNGDPKAGTWMPEYALGLAQRAAY